MIMEHNFETNDNETVKLYDILRQFGAKGLGYVLNYFREERIAVGDTTHTDCIMADVYMNTAMMTLNEYERDGWDKSDHHPLLNNGTYILIETF